MRRLDLAFTALQVPVDLLALVGAAFTAYGLRFSEAFLSIRPIIQQITVEQYEMSGAIFIAAWLVCFWLAGLYGVKPRAAWQELGRIALGSTAGMMIVITSVFFQHETAASRFIVLAMWGLAMAFVWVGRLILRFVRFQLLRRGIGHQNIAVIGSSDAAASLKTLYLKKPSLGYTVVRSYRTWTEAARQEITKLRAEGGIDGILLAEPRVSKEEALDLIAFAEEQHVTFRYLADLFAARFTRIDVTTEGGIPLIEPKGTPLDGWGRITKRVFDMVVSGILLILVSPIMLVTAIAIKVTSRGTILFSKLPDKSPVLRMGEGGKPFHYFKFRSMVMDQHFQRYNELADQNIRKDGPLVKIKNDPRITPVGRVIREWSIDELPELVLVLLGRMSLVGPRPHYVEEVAKYRTEQRKVLAVKPGITGMAQVSGRSDLQFDEEVRLDTWYIEHWSIWLDLLILFKTPFAIFGHRGVERGM